MRLLILAATVDDAHRYAAEQGWKFSAWRYVASLSDLIGCAAGGRNPRATELPTAKRHPQYADFRRALEVRRAVWVPPQPPKVRA